MNVAHCIQPKSEQFKLYLDLLIDIKAFNRVVFDLI